MKKSVFLAFLLLISTPLFAADDAFNGLIWNRNNISTGEVDRGDWYEWWYFKLIDPATDTPFYFLYGVTNPWDSGASPQKDTSRAFVGFGHFGEKWILEKQYPVETMRAEYGRFALDFGNGNAAADGWLQGELNGIGTNRTEHRVKWSLRTATDWRYDAMGWTMRLPWASNIFWYPAQASLFASGTLDIDGKIYEIRDAKGYQDRNWGRGFPKWWAWVVANDFEGSPETVLAGGGGMPKVLGLFDFPVFSMGLRHEGREYTFRINDGDWVNFDIAFGQWKLTLVNHEGFRLDVEGDAPQERFMDLVFLTPQGEEFHDLEALKGHLRVKLSRWIFPDGWNTLAELESHKAGLEFGSRDARIGVQPAVSLSSAPAAMQFWK